MFRILQTRLQQYVNRELPDVQSGFRKGRGTRDQIANIHWIIEKSKRAPEKHLLLKIDKAILKKKNGMEESTCLTLGYTTKQQSSRQYGTGTKTET